MVFIRELIYLNKGWSICNKSICNKSEYKSIGTHWIVLCVNHDNVTYFDSFGVSKETKKEIPKEKKKYSK